MNSNNATSLSKQGEGWVLKMLEEVAFRCCKGNKSEATTQMFADVKGVVLALQYRPIVPVQWEQGGSSAIYSTETCFNIFMTVEKKFWG